MQNKKAVLITGGSRGIGAGIARRLAQSGEYELFLHGRTDSAKLNELATELKAHKISFDISDTLATKEALSNVQEQLSKDGFGAFWGIVLNAGITQDNTFVAISENEWKSVIDTNLNSFFNVLNPLVMPMARARKGRIIVMSSVSGVMGNRGQSNYSASKAGLIGAAKSLAVELASRNITVNVVAPGMIETDMMSQDLPLEEIRSMIPARRFGNVSEVAGIVNFLLGEEASYISRQVIGVNGGMI